MKTEDDYKKLNAWMLTVITNPASVHAGAMDAQRQGLSSASVGAIIKPSSRLDSVERISVYRNAYYARLLECFQVEYPVLKKLLGAELFKAFVFEYLQKYPSRSYTLNQLGAQFPTYLMETQPERKSSDLKQAAWVTLILELAKLERAYTEVYDGPGHEKESLPSASDLLKPDLEIFATLKLLAADCLRLFSFEHDLLEYFLGIRKGLSPDQRPPQKRTWIALIRQEYNMRFFKLSELDYTILQLLFKGFSIQEAIGQIPTELAKASKVSLIAIRSRICILADEGFFKRFF